MRGRRLQVVCGDHVEVRPTGDGGVIERVLPRTTLLYRSDAFRSKAIAANASQIAVVVAARPSFSPELVQRCLLAAEDQGMASLIVLNKADLPESPAARARLEPLARIGYRVVTVCAHTDASPLRPHLEGHVTLLIGQSGMGKSTLLNALCPDAAAATGAYSEALDSGRHTTTHTRLYRLGPDTALIDSPGLQEFALQHLDDTALAHAFVEFRPFLGQCRFRDCRHAGEPGCRLDEAVAAGAIDPARLKLYRTLRQLRKRASLSA